MRHGDAEPELAQHRGISMDEQRPLSAQGRHEVETTANWLLEELQQRGQSQLAWLLVSPYVRAQQTADIMASHIPFRQCETTRDIIPQASPDLFIDWLLVQLEQQNLNEGTVLMVSHMPFVSHLVAALDARTPPLIFPTAGIAEIELDLVNHQAHFLRMIVT